MHLESYDENDSYGTKNVVKKDETIQIKKDGNKYIFKSNTLSYQKREYETYTYTYESSTAYEIIIVDENPNLSVLDASKFKETIILK